MEYLKDIMTQFVRDRLGETNWENREYIKDLYKLERLIKKGGPTSYAESMLNKALQSEYPVEYDGLRMKSVSLKCGSRLGDGRA